MLAACHYATTQTVIEIQADAVVRMRATEIRVELSDSQGNPLRDPVLVTPRASDFFGFPIRIPVTARRGDDTRTFGMRITAVEVTPLADGAVHTDVLATNRIRTGFVRGRILRATLWLLSGCRCSESERCVPDENGDLVPECRPVELDLRDEDDAGVSLDATLPDGTATDAMTDTFIVDSDVVACGSGTHACEGRCVSNFSPLFCGTSCTACVTPNHAIEASCDGSECGFVCASGYSECNGNCVDFASDRAHCNGCGNECPGVQLCVQRECVDPPQCVDESGCPSAGTWCNPRSMRCEPGCNDDNDCAIGRERCSVANHTCDCINTHHRCSAAAICVPRTQLDSCGDSCATCTAPSGGVATCDGVRCDFSCSTGMRCGDACSVCPSGSNIVATGCGSGAMSSECGVRTCAAGYQPSTDRRTCVDVDECATNNGGCAIGDICSNSVGSFVCQASATLRWLRMMPSGAQPTGRYYHAMAYDSVRGRVVLFGGNSNGGTMASDTWEWNGTTWSSVSSSGPSGRSQHAMAYDGARQQTLLFGGRGSSESNETWRWDGSSWTQINVTGPTARRGHSMAYDVVRQRVVLFGGYTDAGGGAFLDDTWEWNGTLWLAIQTSLQPSPRGYAAMAYDSDRQRVVLFGGYREPSSLSDTWEWNGVEWSRTSTDGPVRDSHAISYDIERSRTVLFGGATSGSAFPTYFDDTWQRLHPTWTEESTTDQPTPRYGHQMVYDSQRRTVLLFGGKTSGPRMQDTWVFAVQ